MENYALLSSLIKARRELIAMDQETLADYSGVSVTTISSFENNKGNIGLKPLLSLLDTLGLSLDIKVKAI